MVRVHSKDVSYPATRVIEAVKELKLEARLATVSIVGELVDQDLVIKVPIHTNDPPLLLHDLETPIPFSPTPFTSSPPNTRPVSQNLVVVASSLRAEGRHGRGDSHHLPHTKSPNPNRPKPLHLRITTSNQSFTPNLTSHHQHVQNPNLNAAAAGRELCDGAGLR
ncbi:hypothetical protein Droror1_Dr00004839 [Drosera rotundifolia]